jgi:methylmalonyl-CoA/ethylmalonyl-CoA epimerase
MPTTVRFDHIAIALPSMIDAVPVLAGILGGRPAYGSASAAYRFGQWEFERGGRIEVLEPLGDDGFLARFLARHGPGVHHVTFKVPSLRDACARAENRGYRIVGLDERDPDWKEAFLHPREALGIVVQFAQTSKRGDRPPRGWKPPASVADPPAPVTMVGLRLRARTPERARAQWTGVLLGAETQEADGTLVYRWPESPLRLAVEIDPTRDEGPIAIEYTSARPVALTPQALKTLGVNVVSAG